MSFIKKLQKKPIKTKKKILWTGLIIVTILLFSILIWQWKKRLSSITIPRLELAQEDVKRLKEGLKELRDLGERASTIPGIEQQEIERFQNFREEDIEKLDEEDKKLLEDIIKKIQEDLEERAPEVK